MQPPVRLAKVMLTLTFVVLGFSILLAFRPDLIASPETPTPRPTSTLRPRPTASPTLPAPTVSPDTSFTGLTFTITMEISGLEGDDQAEFELRPGPDSQAAPQLIRLGNGPHTLTTTILPAAAYTFESVSASYWSEPRGYQFIATNNSVISYTAGLPLPFAFMRVSPEAPTFCDHLSTATPGPPAGKPAVPTDACAPRPGELISLPVLEKPTQAAYPTQP